MAHIDFDNASAVADAIANVDSVAQTAMNLTKHYYGLLEATVGTRHPSQILENRIASFVAAKNIQSAALQAQVKAAEIEEYQKRGDLAGILQASAEFTVRWEAYLSAEKVLIACGPCTLPMSDEAAAALEAEAVADEFLGER